jgi:hypothetical protein
LPLALITIVETSAFRADAKACMADAEIVDAINVIAADPKCGAVMRETGGIRKVRFAVAGRGKSGGVRIVYYFHNETRPVYLLAVFAKNEKDNLNKAERNALRKLAEKLV